MNTMFEFEIRNGVRQSEVWKLRRDGAEIMRYARDEGIALPRHRGDAGISVIRISHGKGGSNNAHGVRQESGKGRPSAAVITGEI